MKIDKRKEDKSICMAVGCDRPALYRNARSARAGCKGGYCRRHRDGAVSHAPAWEATASDWVASRAVYQENRPAKWRPLVDDDIDA
jgi:hypothetical protein